ncbi:MAG: rhodanese-like domain-containing protein [Syntrophobacteraceae bacterium]
MGENLTHIYPEPGEAAEIRAELDRKVFYLQTLLDTSRELSGLPHPKKILDTFLLMVMGPLGILQGLGAIINTRTGQGHVTGRGVSESVLEQVSGNLPHIRKKYFTERENLSFSMPRITVIPRESLPDHSLCPAQMQVLILWDLPGDFSGFLGLGERITGGSFGEDEMSILLNLTNILTSTLSHAISFMNTQQLNADLLKKNAELEATLGEVREAREKHAKRIFHMQTLSELNSELRSIIDVEKLLRHFLLTAMGSLGIERGFVLAYDREAKSGKTVYRGIEAERWLSPEVCEMLLYSAFDAMEHKSLAPMSFGRFSAPGLFRDAGVDLDVTCGFFFVIDQNFMGVIAFGPPLSGGTFTKNELDLLANQTAGFMAYLENARAFAKINALNEDLTRRNEQLRRTILELTEARDRITILERARAHVRTVLQREAERVAKVRALDCVLILFFALAIGLLFNFAGPQGIALFPESVIKSDFPSVTAVEAQKLIEEKKAVLVDARPKEFYTQKHIKGAISVPLTLFDIIFMMKLGQLDPQRPIIVYGRTISRLYDVEAAIRLKKRDHEDIQVLLGGIRAWEDAGYQVE